MMQIYLDYSATTPPRLEVITKVQEILRHQWGNPSSLHTWGQRTATIVETARCQVASLINAPNVDSIIFTSGGTEADNLALWGIAKQYSTPQHLIISSVEHSAISETARLLEQRGWQVTTLSVNHQGRVNPLELKEAIRPNTVLVSTIYGQSEVGTIQPIKELAQIARSSGTLFHTDAVQVAGRLALDVQSLGVDLLSLSGHKIYGIQGAGALYVRPGVEISSLLGGGGQERGLRSGTQSVPAIAGLGVAAELAASEMKEETPRVTRLRDRLFELMADCPYLIPTGDRLHRLPHHVSFIVTDPSSNDNREQITGQTIVRQLNLAGIGISAGSACNSGKLSPSPILLAMGYSRKEGLGGIRLTLGRGITLEDTEWTAIVLKQILNRLMQPLVLVIR
jgi:cysteine desulfurase